MQYDFMPVTGSIDVVFIFKRLQEEYCVEGKSMFCGPIVAFWLGIDGRVGIGNEEERNT